MSPRCPPRHFLTASPQQDRGENKVKKLVGQDKYRDNLLLISTIMDRLDMGKINLTAN